MCLTGEVSNRIRSEEDFLLRIDAKLSDPTFPVEKVGLDHFWAGLQSSRVSFRVLTVRLKCPAGLGHVLTVRLKCPAGRGHLLTVRLKCPVGLGHVLTVRLKCPAGRGHLPN